MIRKYSSIEQQSDNPLWELNPGNEYYTKMNEFFIMIEKLSGFRVKRGIEKIESPFPEKDNDDKLSYQKDN